VNQKQTQVVLRAEAGGVGPGELERPRCPEDSAEIERSHAHVREGSRTLAYEWQTAVLGARELEAWPAGLSVRDYVNDVWRRHSGRFSPYYTGCPDVIRTYHVGAFCLWSEHKICLGRDCLHEAIVLHEVAHCLVWHDAHCPDFTGGLAWLWDAVLRIPFSTSWALADELGVAVNHGMPDHPQLPRDF
jgi:hypothetical protein